MACSTKTHLNTSVSVFLHAKFHPNQCMDGVSGPQNGTFYELSKCKWPAGAYPQGRSPWAIFMEFVAASCLLDI